MSEERVRKGYDWWGRNARDVDRGKPAFGYIIPFPGVRYYFFIEDRAEERPPHDSVPITGSGSTDIEKGDAAGGEVAVREVVKR